MEAPLLKPYPNWDAHRSMGDAPPSIVSPFRVRADQCGRLWVIDTGLEVCYTIYIYMVYQLLNCKDIA